MNLIEKQLKDYDEELISYEQWNAVKRFASELEKLSQEDDNSMVNIINKIMRNRIHIVLDRFETLFARWGEEMEKYFKK